MFTGSAIPKVSAKLIHKKDPSLHEAGPPTASLPRTLQNVCFGFYWFLAFIPC